MRKRWHVLTILTLASPALATASLIGISEAREGNYSVARGESETFEARANSPVLLNTNDQVGTKDNEVRIRLTNGSAVVVRNGVVSFPSADVIRVHSGEAAVSFPQGSETVVESGDYKFTPDNESTGSGSLVVANTPDQTVAARSLRGQFAVSDAQNTNVSTIRSVSPASPMLVSTGGYGFSQNLLASGSSTGRPDLFVQANRVVRPGIGANESLTEDTTTIAALPAAPETPVSDSPIVVSPVGPIVIGGGGTAGLRPGFGDIPSSINRDIITYDLEQPVSSFVTDPGDRPPRPRR